MTNEVENAFEKHFGTDGKKPTNKSELLVKGILIAMVILLMYWVLNVQNACQTNFEKWCSSKCPLCIQPAHPYWDPMKGAIVYPNETTQEMILNTTNKT